MKSGVFNAMPFNFFNFRLIIFYIEIFIKDSEGKVGAMSSYCKYVFVSS